jgi:hypothetical protein
MLLNVLFRSPLFLTSSQFVAGLQMLFAESSRAFRLPDQRVLSSGPDNVPECDARPLVSGR